MKIKQFISISFFFILTIHTFSQKSPGYLGKRFEINYGLSFFLAAFNPNAKGYQAQNPYENDDITETSWPLNKRHTFNTYYTISRRTSIGLDITFYKTGVDLSDIDLTYMIDDDEQLFNPGYYFPVSAFEIGPGIKIFDKYLSPMGTYLKLGTSILVYKPIIDNVNDIYEDIEDKATSINKVRFEDSYSDFVFTLGYGNQRIIKDAVFFRYSISSHLPMGSMFKSFKNEYDVEDKIQYASAKRLFHMNWLMLKIGVGVLPF